MQLNKTEKNFFFDILRAEPYAPIRANLKVYDDEFPVMIIPQITPEGYFELRYFGTPMSSPEVGPDGVKRWTGDAIFGVHSGLEKAWNNRDVVILELEERPQPGFPPQNIPASNICANVLVVELNFRGRLSIHKNQILVKKSKLKQVEFCLVDFPAFKKPGHILEDIFLRGTAEYKTFKNQLESIQGRFGDDPVTITITKPLRTTLRAGKEWEITLTEDTEQIRNHVSHSGLITKTNDTEFEIDEVSDLLIGLNQFFAFASCAYRHPTAIIGKDSHDKTVWGQIGKFTLMPKSTNWFDNDNSIPATVYLESLFPKFWTKWQEHPKELTAIVESYVNSKAMRQSGLPKEAIAASYIGLDLLASLVLTDPDPDDSVANVSKALDCYNIPYRRLKQSETPQTTQLARKLGAGRSGPHVIYSTRNYVVHPLERDTDTIKQGHLEYLDDNYSPYFYLHDLCQFYLEYLLLIGLCDYQPQHFRHLTETRDYLMCDFSE